jgi:hypothetical protein
MPNGQESDHPIFHGCRIVTRFMEMPSFAFFKNSDQSLRSAISSPFKVSSWFLCRRVYRRERNLFRKWRASGIR